MDHTRIGLIRRLSTAGLATVVAGAFLLFFIVGSGRAQAPTRSFELLEATIPDLQAALAAGSVTSSPAREGAEGGGGRRETP